MEIGFVIINNCGTDILWNTVISAAFRTRKISVYIVLVTRYHVRPHILDFIGLAFAYIIGNIQQIALFRIAFIARVAYIEHVRRTAAERLGKHILVALSGFLRKIYLYKSFILLIEAVGKLSEHFDFYIVAAYPEFYLRLFTVGLGNIFAVFADLSAASLVAGAAPCKRKGHHTRTSQRQSHGFKFFTHSFFSFSTVQAACGCAYN